MLHLLPAPTQCSAEGPNKEVSHASLLRMVHAMPFCGLWSLFHTFSTDTAGKLPSDARKAVMSSPMSSALHALMGAKNGLVIPRLAPLTQDFGEN